jgi:hypothetical protein
MRSSPANSADKAPAGRRPAEDPILGSSPSSEALLDAAVEYTFPASDPIAIQNAFERARSRERRG